MLDYGDVVYQFAPLYLLSSLDAVYHGALRFISDCKPSTHHCISYNRVGWSSLLIRRKMHWYLIIYKAILGMLPSYLCCLIKQKIVEILPSLTKLLYSVPFVRSELGKKAFMYAAPTDLQKIGIFFNRNWNYKIYCLWIILKVKSSHLYLYSTFNNTDCVKALNSIKLEDRVSVMYNNNKIKHSIFS